MTFDANIVGTISAVYQKSRTTITNCIPHFREEVETLKGDVERDRKRSMAM